MANSTDATGGRRNDSPDAETAALELVERRRDARIAQAHAIHARRVRMIGVLFSGGSMRGLARELGVGVQTLRNELERLEADGIEVPRRSTRPNADQERLPVA